MLVVTVVLGAVYGVGLALALVLRALTLGLAWLIEAVAR